VSDGFFLEINLSAFLSFLFLAMKKATSLSSPSGAGLSSKPAIVFRKSS